MDSSTVLVLLGIACVTLAWGMLVFFHPAVRRRFWPPYRFRPTPWKLPAVLGIFLLLMLFLSLAHWVSVLAGGDRRSPSPENGERSQEVPLPPNEKASQRAHWVIILLKEQPDLPTLLLVIAATGILGPITEEVIFRLFFQGWLHTQELRWYKQRRIWHRAKGGKSPPEELTEAKAATAAEAAAHEGPGMGVWQLVSSRLHWPVGSFSVVLSTGFFAVLHIRSPHTVPPPDAISSMLLERVMAYAAFLGVVLSVSFVSDPLSRYRWGLRCGMLRQDVLLGLGWFLATAAVIYGAQFCFSRFIPETVVADPFTMVLVGGILGILFARTGRIVPSAVFHMSLNMTSVMLAWWVVA